MPAETATLAVQALDPAMLEAFASSQEPIDIFLWRLSAAVGIVLIPLMGYWVRDMHKDFKKMGESLHAIATNQAVGEQRLTDHIDNKAIHCSSPCRRATDAG